MTFFLIDIWQNKDMIKIKIFDENHEKDLERKINDFICNNKIELIDIQFTTAISVSGDDQIYCFSAMIIYK